MRNLKIRLFLLPILLSACSDETTHVFSNRIDARTFTLHTPGPWTLTEGQGYDTYVGRITDGQNTIYFDQGFWSFNGLDKITEAEGTLYFERITVDDAPAIIHKKKLNAPSDDDIILSLYIEEENTMKRNHLYLRNPPSDSRSETLLLEILRTHKFK